VADRGLDALTGEACPFQRQFRLNFVTKGNAVFSHQRNLWLEFARLLKRIPIKPELDFVQFSSVTDRISKPRKSRTGDENHIGISG
jgi:hypothetical protein